jgi:hypothetical protein
MERIYNSAGTIIATTIFGVASTIAKKLSNKALTSYRDSLLLMDDGYLARYNAKGAVPIRAIMFQFNRMLIFMR